MKEPAAREFYTHVGYDSIKRNMHIDECTPQRELGIEEEQREKYFICFSYYAK